MVIDGSQGEGGGQVLRSALTLSLVTGRPFRIEHIRARRPRPGLLRQHLTAVAAAMQIGEARVSGAALNSRTLQFEPGPVRGGDYHFAIGTAGSCTLVLQTVLPALWTASTPSSVVVSGGTHNPMAPPADFLVRAWMPWIRKMGVEVEIELLRHGFYPAGGGQVRSRVLPCARLNPVEVSSKGALVSVGVEARVAGVPGEVASREIEQFRRRHPEAVGRVTQLPSAEGPGNVLLADVEHEHVREVFASFGERRLRAETVAEALARQVRHYVHSEAAVGEHLADQLVLPMALAGGGAFTTTTVSPHLSTNLDIVSRFLPVRAIVTPGENVSRVEIVPA